MPGKRGLPVDVRFWSKVAKGSPNECWGWNACLDNHGYGIFRLCGKNRLAHRMAYELASGAPPPPDLHVCHRCDNPPCVNPAHLFLGTAKVNQDDKNAKGRGNQGERHGLSRLTNEVVLTIRAEYAAGARKVDLARKHGLRPPHVLKIVTRQSWKHI
jgi:hypothetical protein